MEADSNTTITQPLTVSQVVAKLEDVRRQWDELLLRIGEERRTEPGATGNWSVKDVVAHITLYEKWTLERLQERAQGIAYSPENDDPETDGMDMDTRNDYYYKRDSARGLADILTESKRVHAELVQLVRNMSEEELHTPLRLTDTVSYNVIETLEGNGYEHYEDHIRELEAWLQKSPASQE